MQAVGEHPELPDVLYELEERIGALTPRAIDLVAAELEKPWRTIAGLEWRINVGRQLRDQWLSKMPRRPDPSWTPQEVKRMEVALALHEREIATFARLMRLMSEVAAEPSPREIPAQAVLDQAWKRLDRERADKTHSSE